jgi:hypothetical protein
LRDESDATTHRTPKALGAKFMADAFPFRESFGNAHASSPLFDHEHESDLLEAKL